MADNFPGSLFIFFIMVLKACNENTHNHDKINFI